MPPGEAEIGKLREVSTSHMRWSPFPFWWWDSTNRLDFQPRQSVFAKTIEKTSTGRETVSNVQCGWLLEEVSWSVSWTAQKALKTWDQITVKNGRTSEFYQEPVQQSHTSVAFSSFRRNKWLNSRQKYKCLEGKCKYEQTGFDCLHDLVVLGKKFEIYSAKPTGSHHVDGWDWGWVALRTLKSLQIMRRQRSISFTVMCRSQSKMCSTKSKTMSTVKSRVKTPFWCSEINAKKGGLFYMWGFNFWYEAVFLSVWSRRVLPHA